MKNYAFYRLLHSRRDEKTGWRMTTARLAELSGSGRAHVTEVLNNKPGHGHFTRRRLFPHLTRSEVRLLGWMPEYDRWRASQQRSTENIVPA
jgi:hypothetical protein